MLRSMGADCFDQNLSDNRGSLLSEHRLYFACPHFFSPSDDVSYMFHSDLNRMACTTLPQYQSLFYRPETNRDLVFPFLTAPPGTFPPWQTLVCPVCTPRQRSTPTSSAAVPRLVRSFPQQPGCPSVPACTGYRLYIPISPRFKLSCFLSLSFWVKSNRAHARKEPHTKAGAPKGIRTINK